MKYGEVTKQIQMIKSYLDRDDLNDGTRERLAARLSWLLLAKNIMEGKPYETI